MFEPACQKRMHVEDSGSDGSDNISDFEDFNKNLFVQQAHFNPQSRAVESFLYSTCKQTIQINSLNTNIKFAEWETLQTEQSFKYSVQDIENLACESGFKITGNFYDSKRYFVDSLWEVIK